MPRRLLCLTLAGLMAAGHTSSNAAGTSLRPHALLVTGPGHLSTGDQAVKVRLEKLGYTVDASEAVEAKAEPVEPAVVLVSASAPPRSWRGKYAKSNVPVMTWHPALLSELGMAGTAPGLDFGSSAQDTIVLSTLTHPMAAGLYDRVKATSSISTLGWAAPASSAILVATLSTDTNKAALFGFEKGAQTLRSPAAARRVGFLLGGSSASLTRDGWTLFEAALRWVVAKNKAPKVSAGTGLDVVLPAAVRLDGTIEDDGAPEPAWVKAQWSVVSGSGSVAFGDPSRAATMATFRTPGEYVLRLTANDGLASAFDEVPVTVRRESRTSGAPAASGGGSQTVLTGQTALMIVGNTTLSAGDTVLKSRLQTLVGAGTIVIKTALAATTSDATGKALILISHTANAADLGTKFQTVAVPVVDLKFGTYANMKMTATADAGTTPGTQVAISAVNPSHPLAAGLTGTVTVSSQSKKLNWGVPSVSAIPATYIPGSSTHAAIFGYEAGTAMVGLNAPARRVGFFVGEDVIAANLTTQGARLFDAALGWATQTNLRPWVDAGPDVKMTVASTVPLTGSVADDDLPSPHVLTSSWSVVSGPGNVTFGGPSSASTTAVFSTAGSYVLRLTATDGALSQWDDVNVTMVTANQPPVVNAGPDQSNAAYPTASLAGSAVDSDQVPTPPGVVTVAWSTVSGPGGVTFSAAQALSTSVTFTAPGTYVLRLTANDSVSSASDDVTIGVKGNALLVIDDPTTPNWQLTPGESVLKTHLESLGYTVAVKADGGGTNGSVSADANGKAVVVISPACQSGQITTKFKSTTTPVVDLLIGNWDDMALTVSGTRAAVCGQDSVAILKPSDPIAAAIPSPSPIPIGQKITILNPGLSGNLSYGTPAAQASGAAGVPLPLPSPLPCAAPSPAPVAASRAVFTYDTGATMVGGYIARGRRVALGFQDNILGRSEGGVNVENLNANGKAMLDAALKWATATNYPPVVNVDNLNVAFNSTPTLVAIATDDGMPNGTSTFTFSWSVVSKPAGADVQFGTQSGPTARQTTASFTLPGVYVLRFTANDGQLSTSDDMTVQVHNPPTVSAGSDLTVTFPGGNLDGTATDDGRPNPPGAITVAWTKVSGPGTVSFANGTAQDTAVTFSVEGTYVLRFTANDDHLSTSDDVTVIANRRPDVEAGPDQTISFPAGAKMAGVVNDDGLPGPAIKWWSVVGTSPGTVTFENANDPLTNVTFGAPGLYVLRLTADDGHDSASDDVSVLVNGPPVVSAGSDLSVTLPAAATLDGTVTDTTLPSPPGAVVVAWSKVSGPGAVTFANANTVATAATFSLPGTYVVRLMASDGFLNASDDVTVTVLVGGSPTVLLVTGSAPSPSDIALQNQLQAWGYAVLPTTDAASTTADAAGRAVVLITGSANAAEVGTKFRDVTVSVVVAQPLLLGTMRMTGTVEGAAFGSGTDQTLVSVTNPTHPIAAGLSGTVSVFSSPATLGWGVPPPGATIVAQTTTQGEIALFAYEQGAAMTGASAPARRVGIFIDDAASSLTSEGWQLLNASLYWSCTRLPAPVFTPGPGTVTAVPFAVTLSPTNDPAVQYFYTTDGSEPTQEESNEESNLYSGSISVTTTSTIKAKAFKAGWEASATTSGTYTVSLGTLAAPTISWDPVMQTATISAAPEAAIRYTTNGSIPSTGSMPYTGALTITDTTTLKARAFRTDWTPSVTTTAFIEIDSDHDGLSNVQEQQLGTDPNNADTNGDGIDDGAEVALGLSPTNMDMDADGVINPTEIAQGTDPFRPDTDGDGMNDGPDCFPLDVSRQCPAGDPTDHTPPDITLTEPTGAALVSSQP